MKERDISTFLEVNLIRRTGWKDPENPKPREARPFKVPMEDGAPPSALEVLLKAREGPFPDLAFRYGCRNQRCGLCAIEINGEPALACRAKVSNGDLLGPLRALPLVRDFVVERSGVSTQLSGRLRWAEEHRSSRLESPGKHYVSLSRCIECYACLEACPLHQENLEERPGSTYGLSPTENPRYARGNPCTFLKLKRLIQDDEVVEGVRKEAVCLALGLGLEACSSCYGCRCQIGINLVGEVIRPLLADVGLKEKV